MLSGLKSLGRKAVRVRPPPSAPPLFQLPSKSSRSFASNLVTHPVTHHLFRVRSCPQNGARRHGSSLPAGCVNSAGWSQAGYAFRVHSVGRLRALHLRVGHRPGPRVHVPNRVWRAGRR